MYRGHNFPKNGRCDPWTKTNPAFFHGAGNDGALWLPASTQPLGKLINKLGDHPKKRGAAEMDRGEEKMGPQMSA